MTALYALLPTQKKSKLKKKIEICSKSKYRLDSHLIKDYENLHYYFIERYIF